MTKYGLASLAFLAIGVASAAYADDPAQPPAPAVMAPTGNVPVTSGAEDETASVSVAKKRGSKSGQQRVGKRNSEKETDGSEASDRFEANTVIKSRYRVNGEQLEVDPD